MKRIITLSLLFFVAFVSCQKESVSKNNRYLENVKAALKDSVSASDYTQFDFSRAVLSKVDSVQLYCLRIPLKGMKLEKDFVILKTSSWGKIEAGRIVHLEGNEVEYGEGAVKRRTFNGN